MTVPDELLDKYGRNGPRYTSYPTVPHWSDAVGSADWAKALSSLGAGKAGPHPVELYVHLPFCKRPCSFCGCHFVVMNRRDPIDQYVDRVEEEARLVAKHLADGVQVTGLHFGGGTPTHLDPAQLGRLIDSLERHFDFAADAERSIEVHPHVTRPEHMELLAARGFRRLSLGVQDLTPEVQSTIHRFQTVEETQSLMAHARSLGFESLNVDLIYGLPKQTVRGLVHTVELVVEAGADRLAVYGYAHVPWLKANQRGIREEELPDPTLRRDLYRAATDALVGAGFQSIGLDHFARPEDELFKAQADGTLGRGFMGYTVRRAWDLIGLGPSAIGDSAGTYAQNAPALESWHQAIGEGRFATERGCVTTDDDRQRRAVIESILCLLRFDFRKWSERFGLDPREVFAAELEALLPFVDDGLVEFQDHGFVLTETGRYLSRNVAMVFDAHLKSESPSTARYSRTV